MGSGGSRLRINKSNSKIHLYQVLANAWSGTSVESPYNGATSYLAIPKLKAILPCDLQLPCSLGMGPVHRRLTNVSHY